LKTCEEVFNEWREKMESQLKNFVEEGEVLRKQDREKEKDIIRVSHLISLIKINLKRNTLAKIW